MGTVTILDDYQGVALASADWTRVQAHFEIDVVREHLDDLDTLADRLAGTEVLVAMRERTPITSDLLDRLPRLRLIVTTGLRNNAIDVEAARARGVVVSGTQGSSTSVAELVFGMMIALMRGFVAEDSAIRAGGWQHTIGPGLSGSTLGIVGLGRLGIPVARLGRAFGMDLIAWSPHLTTERAAEHGVRAVTKDELFAAADVVTIHVPLSDASRGLVGSPDLAAMKPTAYLINTSRGPVVDEDALLNALRTKGIAGAGLDVYSVEPLPPDHPLRTAPRTLLLPHVGYVTTDNYRAWFTQVVEDIAGWHAGTALRLL